MDTEKHGLYLFTGCFIECNRYRNGKLDNQPIHIKLTEIKAVKDFNEYSCLFNTFKDCQFFVPITSGDLLTAINIYIFKPDEYWKVYIERDF